MSPPSISVVIPTHNRAPLLVKAVDSVLAQTLQPREVIVVDDASTDDTGERVDAYGPPVRRLTVAESIERGAARNLGAAQAEGELLAFLDSDDEWEPDKLARQAGLLGPDRACVTGVRFVDAEGRGLGTAIPPSRAAGRIALENIFLGGASTLVVPAAVFRSAGGFPEHREIQGSEDWVLFGKLVSGGWTINVLPEPLVRYRVHGASWTGEPDNVARSMWAAVSWFERSGVARGRTRRRLRARTASVIGRHYASRGRWRAAGRWTMTAWRSGDPAEAAYGSARLLASGLKHRLVSPR